MIPNFGSGKHVILVCNSDIPSDCEWDKVRSLLAQRMEQEIVCNTVYTAHHQIVY